MAARKERRVFTFGEWASTIVGRSRLRNKPRKAQPGGCGLDSNEEPPKAVGGSRGTVGDDVRSRGRCTPTIAHSVSQEALACASGRKVRHSPNDTTLPILHHRIDFDTPIRAHLVNEMPCFIFHIPHADLPIRLVRFPNDKPLRRRRFLRDPRASPHDVFEPARSLPRSSATERGVLRNDLFPNSVPAASRQAQSRSLLVTPHSFVETPAPPPQRSRRG